MNIEKRVINVIAEVIAVQRDQIKPESSIAGELWRLPHAGFGGVLNAFELMKAMIEAGAAGVHFEDQLAAAIAATGALIGFDPIGGGTKPSAM